ncbi:MAG: type II secretion system F family protein [Candidatus Latescibacteria bacterium]|jgi:tight adherence protein B|nr:type II secretion system F family protein [Candidatus Latescibacterota bacterium]
MTLGIIIVGLIVLLILIGIGVYVSSSSERNMMEERLGKYIDQEQADRSKKGEKSSQLVTDWVNRRVEKSSSGEKLARSLARADLKFKPGEFIAFLFILSFGLGGLAWFLGGDTPTAKTVSAILGVVLGLGVPLIYVRSQQGRRLDKFNNQLSDMLNLMVNGLRAGYSTMQAMEAISKELPAPINEEFRRVVQEMQLGISMDKALENLLRRIPSEDLDFVITAINVQREVGGPLAEILDTIAFTIRERVRIKGEIRVMTAQVRTSATILSAIPFVLFTIIWLINQEYMMEFFTNILCGGIAIGVSFLMIGLGYAVMMKIADIEV